MTEIKDRLRLLRRTLDLTQTEFAEKIGSVQNTITGYESGRRSPSNPVITSICNAWNVNEEWLRNGTGEMFAADPKDELEALVKKYDLTAADQVLIEKYVSLKPGTRDAILRFMSDVVASLQDEKDCFSDIPDTPEELEQKFPPLKDEDKEGGLG